ncbi:MAG: hypothetical protein PUD13_10525 [Lachnospira sp.]|nr:hypothetical protein [Lachnospira sp.]
MKVLVINGDCVTRNSSANLCHMAYIRGLVNLGYEVTLLSADPKEYDVDKSMIIPSSVKCIYYYGTTIYEKMSISKSKSKGDNASLARADYSTNESKLSIKSKLVNSAKNFVLSSYGIHGIYSKFVKKAQKFKSDTEYDIVLSLSTPVTSHLLTYNLLKSGHIKAKKWIQVWEDPWYVDAYGFNGKEKIYKEEKRLLSYAQRVCYVSPLTLKNQKEIFPESAHKMYWAPLPFYYKNDEQGSTVNKYNNYGYFGDYAPVSRDLAPFYAAAKNIGVNVNICGNPSNLFAQTDKITIYPRLQLGELKPIEDKTNVLVFLCNRKGGQIPGKIYQYSATYKTILFILDGTDEEKKVLKSYFEQFNRYIFCENTVEDIERAIKLIENNDFGNVKNEPIDEFNPAKTIMKVLEG